MWDTECFRLSVTDRKIEKAATLVLELSSSTGRWQLGRWLSGGTSQKFLPGYGP